LALDSSEPVQVLLSGPPASAKTMFLQSMMTRPSTNFYFVDGGNTTKAEMIDYKFENEPT
jgi:Holliday junction DNA helicase RuvB